MNDKAPNSADHLSGLLGSDEAHRPDSPAAPAEASAAAAVAVAVVTADAAAAGTAAADSAVADAEATEASEAFKASKVADASEVVDASDVEDASRKSAAVTAVDTEAAETAAEIAAVSSTGFASADANESEAVAVELAWMPPDVLPGEVFAARREELRWSLEEAATRLKLTPRQVSALEANDFASLPGMSSVRGFIRSYAKTLGLDPEPLLEMVAREPNPAHGPMVLRRPLPSNGFPGRPSAPPPGKSKWRNRIILALVLLVAGFAAGFEAYRSQWVQIPPVAQWMAELPLPDIGLLEFLAASSPDTEPSQSGETLVVEAAPGMAKPLSAPAPAHAPALQLKLREDAWVEITTVGGERIVSQLIKGGTTAAFDITEPSVLVVGNAAAVEARLRGQLLNLKSVARDNVSKLSIK
ncbi:MAG: helix-turn-helix domain-containing protein [Oxalobacteraceae bacterium]